MLVICLSLKMHLILRRSGEGKFVSIYASCYKQLNHVKDATNFTMISSNFWKHVERILYNHQLFLFVFQLTHTRCDHIMVILIYLIILCIHNYIVYTVRDNIIFFI